MALRMLPAALVAGGLVLSSTACAPGEEPAPSSGAGDSRLAPDFKKKKHGDLTGPHSPGGGKGDLQGGTRPSGQPSPAAQTPDATAPGSAGSSAPAPSGSAPLTARTADPGGDVSGLSAPAYVDLTGATLRLAHGTWTLRVETAGQVPEQQDGSETTNVFGFFDTDLDGSLDYQVGAGLADSGWGTSYRYPGGARFGSESGVAVTAEGSALVFTFDAGLLDGDDTLQWSVGAEHGSYEQVATGTTAQDLAPDSGGVAFPG